MTYILHETHITNASILIKRHLKCSQSISLQPRKQMHDTDSKSDNKQDSDTLKCDFDLENGGQKSNLNAQKNSAACDSLQVGCTDKQKETDWSRKCWLCKIVKEKTLNKFWGHKGRFRVHILISLSCYFSQNIPGIRITYSTHYLYIVCILYIKQHSYYTFT